MKRDLLQECNDQRIPPRDFTQTFCIRCRNPDCVNAGWSGSAFEQRVSTQVDRLLKNPVIARPEDTRFDPLRAMHFVEVAAAIALRRREDPWAGPGVHLAEPSPSTVTLPTVEDAVARLAAARGRSPEVAVVTEPDLVVEPPRETRTTLVETGVDTAPVVAEPPPQPAPVTRLVVNTEFPEEGVMLGGGAARPPETTVVSDPWAPKPRTNVVPAGARIKMGS